MISNNVCYSANSSVKIEDCLDKQQAHNTASIDPSEMTEDEQLAEYADIIGWEEGEDRNIMTRIPYRTKDGQENSTLIPQKCTYLGNGKLRIIPQENVYENGKKKKDGTCFVWKNANNGIKLDISYFNNGLEEGDFTNIGIKPNRLKGGIGAKHFVSSSCLFFENDKLDPEPQKERIDWLSDLIGIDFSILFTGGRSYHVYISLDAPIYDAEQWKYAQHLLISLALSDTAIQNVDREMRPPGTLRLKEGEIKTCHLVKVSKQKYNPEFAIRQLEKAFLKVYGIDPKKLNPYEWKQLYSKIQTAIDAGATHEHIKELANKPIKPKPQAKTPEEIKEIKQRLETECKEGEYHLVDFLSKTNQEASNGVAHGTIHNRMRDLANELVAARDLLEELGINYIGDAREIFEDACDRCEIPVDATERDRLWNYAESSNFEYLGGEERVEKVCAWHDYKAGKRKKPSSGNGNEYKLPDWVEHQLRMLTELKDTPLPNVEYVHIKEQWLGDCLPNLIEKGAFNLLVSYTGSEKTKGLQPVIQEAGYVKAVFYLDTLGIDACNRLGIKWHKTQGNSLKFGVSVPSAFKYFCNDLRRKDAVYVLDELDQTIDQRFSRICKKERPVILKSFENDMICALAGGGTGIGASADISGIHVEYLRKLIPEQFKIRVIINDFIPERTTVKMLKGKKEILIQELIEELERVEWDESGNPKWGIFVANTFKADGEAMGKTAERRLEKKLEQMLADGKITEEELRDKILEKHPEWASFIVIINSDNSKQAEIVEYCENINTTSIRTLILIASPSLVSGFNISNGHFRTLFCFNHGNITAKMVGQFIARVRGCQDIRIWSADYYNNKVANGSYNPDKIRNWYTSNYAKNQIHLNHYGVAYDALRNEHKESPHFILKSQTEAYYNICCDYPTAVLKLHLEKAGYKVEEYERNELLVKASHTKEEIKIHKAHALVKYALEVAHKPLLSLGDFNALPEEKTLEEKQKATKYLLHKNYGDDFAAIAEVDSPLSKLNKEEKEKSKLTGYAALYLMDKQGIYKKLKMLWMVLHPDGSKIAAKLDRDEEEPGIWHEQHGQGKRLFSDTSQLTVKVGLLKKLSFNFNPGEPIPLDERKRIVDKLRAEADYLKNWLGFNIPENVDDEQLFSLFVSKVLGLKTKSVQKRINGERIRFSVITQKSWEYFEKFKEHQDILQKQRDEIEIAKLRRELKRRVDFRIREMATDDELAGISELLAPLYSR